MAESNVTVEDIDSILTPERAIDELMLHLDGEAGPIDLPMSLAADLGPDAHVTELRIYFSRWPLSGVRGVRPPLLQPDPKLQAPDIVGEYHRALAAGDVDAVVEAFEPEGYVREPSGGAATHRGTNELRAFYELLIFDRGVMPFELCAVADDGRACALEYNMAARGQPESAPGAGIAVHVRGDGGKLAAVRSYDDVHPPLDRRTNTQGRSR
jgi:limonene-1,2-epoxide hydrolase